MELFSEFSLQEIVQIEIRAKNKIEEKWGFFMQFIEHAKDTIVKRNDFVFGRLSYGIFLNKN